MRLRHLFFSMGAVVNAQTAYSWASAPGKVFKVILTLPGIVTNFPCFIFPERFPFEG